MDQRNAFRCFDRRYMGESLIAAVVLLGLAFVGKRFAEGSPARIAIGLGEALAFGYLFAVTLVRIRLLDELGQRIHLIAIAVAFALSGLTLTAAGYLSAAGVPVPSLELWMGPVMMVMWGVGVIVISRRYR